jgi:hypothetical protein
MLEEEKKIIDEILNTNQSENDDSADHQTQQSILVRKYLHMKNYLKKSESKFIDLEKQNLKSIQQIYALLSREQKLNLIRNYFIFDFYSIEKRYEFVFKIKHSFLMLRTKFVNKFNY